jgi:hypothetical protein
VVEQRFRKPSVAGSIPAIGSTSIANNNDISLGRVIMGRGEGRADRWGGNEVPPVDRKPPGRATQERPGEGEDGVAVEAGKHYDVEMDCATVADGKLDECIELPGKLIEMSGKLSKVRTDVFLVSVSSL